MSPPGAKITAEPSSTQPALPWRVVRLVLEAVIGAVSAVDDALAAPRTHRRIAMDVLIGGGVIAGEATGWLFATGRSVGRGVLRLPLVRPGAELLVSQLAERGRRERTEAATDIQRLTTALVPAVLAAVLDRIDLTALVRDRVALDDIVATVDLDAVAARIDVDSIARRVDLDAIVDRLDLVALTNRVIDGIDLPEIIRESTGSVTGGLVHGVRMQGIEADQAMTGLVARMLRRRPRQPPGGPAVAGAGAP